MVGKREWNGQEGTKRNWKRKETNVSLGCCEG